MLKAGILGGGQLGRMLLQAAANYPVETYVMESDPECPAAHLCHHFVQGNIRDFDEVYRFGRGLHLLTIEIEHVNVDALEKLESEGVNIFPKPAALRIIGNKILQKQFYTDHTIPTSAYTITEKAAELEGLKDWLPAVHKLATGGYDGRGVQILRDEKDLPLGFDAPAVLEKMIDIRQEIAIIIAVDQQGETAIYPPVDMVFDPILNQLSHQICPAELPEKVFWKADAIALKAVKQLNSPGIFAVEMFSDNNEQVYVNEIAPRVHNSGHHTIEGSYSSQFDMLWRVMLQYPLGNPASVMPSALVNVIGAPGHQGPAVYDGLDKALAIDNAFIHMYGKKDTKPGRKMGHITILHHEKQDLLHKVNLIHQHVQVISKT